jgi:multisubunit Na+/H+ antiporter MnhB subunit
MLLVAGRYTATTPGFESFRLLGFTLGGMLSIATLVLCIYYLGYARVRTVGVTIATASAAIYGFAFIAVLVALFLFTNDPFASKLVDYAF